MHTAWVVETHLLFVSLLWEVSLFSTAAAPHLVHGLVSQMVFQGFAEYSHLFLISLVYFYDTWITGVCVDGSFLTHRDRGGVEGKAPAWAFQ